LAPPRPVIIGNTTLFLDVGAAGGTGGKRLFTELFFLFLIEFEVLGDVFTESDSFDEYSGIPSSASLITKFVFVKINH
jgi:hypothetical protein